MAVSDRRGDGFFSHDGGICAAQAQRALQHIKIGLVLSLTGLAASIGIPTCDTVALLPKEMGGRPVDYIVLDDASDTTQAVQSTKKLISVDQVDAIIGSSITPNSLAMIRCRRRRQDADDLAGVVGEDHRTGR